MGKSFHITIDEKQFEVDHKGDLRVLELPVMYQEIEGLTEDKDALMAWIEKHDIILPVIQCALQKRIIDLRAIARPTVKKYKDDSNFNAALSKIAETGDEDNYNIDKKNLEISLKIGMDDKCQKRLNDSEWKAIARPGQTKATKAIEEKAVETLVSSIQMMLEMGNDLDQIEKNLNKNFSSEVVSQAMTAIQKAIG